MYVVLGNSAGKNVESIWLRCVKTSTSILKEGNLYVAWALAEGSDTYFMLWGMAAKGEIWQELKGPEEPFGLQVYNFCPLNMNLLENAAHFEPDVSSVPWR